MTGHQSYRFTRDEAIEYIMDHYGESLKRTIFTYVKNHHTTDDLFQEVLILIYRKWERFNGESHIKTWVMRIAINRCKDYLRSPLHRIKIAKDKWLEQKDPHYTDQRVIQKEQWDEIANAILDLPVKYREVMILTFQQDMTQKQIAELMDIPLSTIKTRMQRARQLLRKKMDKGGMDPWIINE
ncbi:RNA polymerase sigma-70 factor, ECF subfamily [Halobacillus dabanensis]|uniref:RNA polymerase sigma-70 factor, ECF subfamily n=1 Tax=Halobacillus dabanensis TaxID=240302 RepID=A0A1I4AVP5_HALDA|nr:sigma-70 family RNA polymerase sigma factor [Halobacillus dabanensis]SFK59759.1 RNA polymerase sigma-70 factor, ECF subfamily [Halobacillus dabanensis]